jgi:peptidoglycan/LPS O-acetylase OafA/YrhL
MIETPVAELKSLPGRERLASLDGLRAISVLLIICAHGFASRGLPAWLTLATGAIFQGGLGVQIFFTLSGFLITTILLEEKRREGTISIRNFYARRLARILPANYFYLAALSILAIAGIITISTNNLAAAAGYVLNYQRTWRADDGAGYWYVGHLWTLCIEQQFYLVWPFAILAFSKRNLLRLCVALIFLLPVLRVIHYYAFPSVRAQLGLFFHTGADCIFVGSLAAILAGEPWNLRKRAGDLHWLWPALAGAWLLWGVVWSRAWGGWWNVGPSRAVISGATVLLMFWLTVHPSSAFGKILNSRPLIYFGSVSYGLFLWQQLFLNNASGKSLTQIAAGLFAAFAISVISYELAEKRIGAWARRNFPSRLASAAKAT